MRNGLARWLQVLHLTLLILVPVLYAAIVGVAPATDPLRQSLSQGVAILSAVWAAAVVVATLRRSGESDVKTRAFGTYRRLLNWMPTLIASTFALAAVGLLLGFALFAYRQVVFHNATETGITVYLSDPDRPERTLVSVPPHSQAIARLRIGERWIFLTPSADPTRPFSPATLQIRSWPGGVPPFTVSEIPLYER